MNKDLYKVMCPYCRTFHSKTSVEWFMEMWLRCDGCGKALDITAEEDTKLIFTANKIKE